MLSILRGKYVETKIAGLKAKAKNSMNGDKSKKFRESVIETKKQVDEMVNDMTALMKKADFFEVKNGSALHAREEHPNFEYYKLTIDINEPHQEMILNPYLDNGWQINSYKCKNGRSGNHEVSTIFLMRFKETVVKEVV